MGLRLQRYFGAPGLAGWASSSGEWLIQGAGLRLRRVREPGERTALWRVQPSEWSYAGRRDPAQRQRARYWLTQAGLTEARFPTRRAALRELKRLQRSTPLTLTEQPAR